MGVEAPFLYDHPARYSFTGPTEKGFNPKAATQASWAPAPSPRIKVDGPLINSKEFNRHPDSYFVVPYGQLDWTPMSPRTKQQVKYARWAQLFLRICALLGAAGMLVCVICIKGTDGSVAWIIRIPPAIAILHAVYAVYHLARSSKGRTPASCASYHLFAAIIDIGLIPFFVFTALMSRSQYTQPMDTTGEWQTLFNDDSATYKVIFATFLLSIVDGALHLISLAISIYLAITFRRISKLPPDMNPLEDNLTSRRHKRNKSSLVDNRLSQIKAATNRESQAEDPLISPPRTVPFFHTRNDSADSLGGSPTRPRSTNNSPYNHSPSHRSSRIDVSSENFYGQPTSHRSSRADLPPSKMYAQSTSHRSSRIDLNYSPAPSSPMKTHSRPTSTRPPSTRAQSTAPSDDPSNNWVTYPSPPNSPGLPIADSPPPLPAEFKHLRTTNLAYTPIPQSVPKPRPWDSENFYPRPLEMNPPTPANAEHRHSAASHRSGTQVRDIRQEFEERALTPATGNRSPRPGAGARQESFGPAGGKMRFYGKMAGGGGRVVSSGADVDGFEGEGRGGEIRAREVSGKIIEEGRWVGRG